jgi:L-fuconolactonase
VVQDELDPDFLSGASFNRGIEHLKDFGLTYDILILSQQLTATISFVDRHPEQPFVLDHIAKPTIANNQFDREWEVNIRELARRPHVSCKFSGVVTEVRDDSWTTDLIRPYWQIALEAFSPQRLMFGSDWPVCLIKSSYERWHATCLELSSSLSDSEKKWFWGDTAAKVYDLS